MSTISPALIGRLHRGDILQYRWWRLCSEVSRGLFLWFSLVLILLRFVPYTSPAVRRLCSVIFGSGRDRFWRVVGFSVPANVLGGVFFHVAITFGELSPPFRLVAGNPLSLGFCGRALQGLYSIHDVTLILFRLQDFLVSLPGAFFLDTDVLLHHPSTSK